MRNKKILTVVVAAVIMVGSAISASATSIALSNLRVNYNYNGSYYYSQGVVTARASGGGKGKVVVGLVKSNGSTTCTKTTTVNSGVTANCYSGQLQGQRAARAYAYTA